MSEYTILTIAKEAQNYFQLDEIRKQRIRDSLKSKLNEERKRFEKAKVKF